jgi:hypothetical protein
MQMKQVTAKLGNMRKAAEWTVYPPSTGDRGPSVTIQSDTRIAQFFTDGPAKGKGFLSKARSSGAYFIHLLPALGATPVLVPQDVIDAVLAVQPKSGDAVGPGVTIA